MQRQSFKVRLNQENINNFILDLSGSDLLSTYECHLMRLRSKVLKNKTISIDDYARTESMENELQRIDPTATKLTIDISYYIK